VNNTYRRTLLALAVVSALALVAAWIVGTIFVVRPVVRTFELERRARERLELMDQMRSDFVSMVSHELRNPMATIRGFAQILRDQPEVLSGEKRHEASEVIVRQVDRMASLVDNVLEVSRIESDTFSYAFAPYDLRALLAECVSEARASYPAHRVWLDAPETLPRASGDRERLKQVFDNLVSNACRYSADGADVVVRLHADARAATVEIVDHGTGIAPEHQGMLFQRFARLRTPDTANIRGTGLGLYISRRIVEAHSGRIWVKSERGSGSTFSVEMPLDPPPPDVSGNGAGRP
jgi:signal transduction histidine kinase